MKKNMLRISAVSYINAMPFVYGIKNSGFLTGYSLSLDIPAVCADKLLRNKVDIGLAPVAILPRLKKHFIISDYCIGANGAVSSVMLYSEVPLPQIREILLDNQSRTSVMLVQVLARYFWKISPHWIPAKKGYEKKIRDTTAGVVIGDRNFKLAGKFSYAYDLSEEWKLFTGLPFVFACWIANKKLKKGQLDSFSGALKFGIQHKHEVLKGAGKGLDKKMITRYLDHYIDYRFNAEKKKALNLFLRLARKIV